MAITAEQGAGAVAQGGQAAAFHRAGLASLVLLPPLLVASLVTGAPLAVPAAAGLGYLLMARALDRDHDMRATWIHGAVLAALIAWLIIYILGEHGGASQLGMAVALITPAVAAAPAIALRFPPKEIAVPVAAKAGEAAPRDTDEALDPKSSTGARARQCSVGRSHERMVASGQIAKTSGFDVSEAVAWALQQVIDTADEKDLRVDVAVDPGLVAGGDLQTGRRIVSELIDHGFALCDEGSTFAIRGRRLRGVALLRAECLRKSEPSGQDAADAPSLLSTLDELGGTLVAEQDGRRIVLSARLAISNIREQGQAL